jgi:hypothetical protein
MYHPRQYAQQIAPISTTPAARTAQSSSTAVNRAAMNAMTTTPRISRSVRWVRIQLVWSSPASVDTGRLGELPFFWMVVGDRLELLGREKAECGVSAAAVEEDLDVLEDLRAQLGL